MSRQPLIFPGTITWGFTSFYVTLTKENLTWCFKNVYDTFPTFDEADVAAESR